MGVCACVSVCVSGSLKLDRSLTDKHPQPAKCRNVHCDELVRVCFFVTVARLPGGLLEIVIKFQNI